MSPGKIIEWSGAVIVASIAGLVATGFLVIFAETVKHIFQ